MMNKQFLFIFCIAFYFGHDGRMKKPENFLWNSSPNELHGNTSSSNTMASVYEKEVQKFEQSEDRVNVVRCKNNFGDFLRKSGKHREARPILEEALEIGNCYLDWQHPEVVRSNLFLGIVMAIDGKLDKSIFYCEKVIEATKTNKNELIASAYNCMGADWFNKGYYIKALEYHEEALKIREAVLGKNHLDVAKSYNNIGNVYSEKAEYDKALEYYEKALKIREKVLGKNHPDVARSYNNIGNVYSEKAEYGNALKFYEKALDIRRKMKDKNPYCLRVSYNNIGIVYEAQGDHKMALAYFEEALKMAEDLFGKEHQEVAMNYRNIGQVYFVMEDYKQTLKYYQIALDIREKKLGRKHPDVATIYDDLGHVYKDQGKHRKALMYFQKAIAANVIGFESSSIYEKLDLDTEILSDWGVLNSLRFKAETFVSAGNKILNLKTVVETYIVAFQLLDTIRKNAPLEDTRLNLGQKSGELCAQAIPVCLDIFRLTGEQEYLDKAFNFAERGKAPVLSGAFQKLKAEKFADVPNELFEKEQRLKISRNFYKQAVLKARVKGDSIKLAINQDSLFHTNRALEKLIRELETQYPRYYELKYKSNTASITDVQAKLLDEKSALVEYVVGDSTIWVFTITADTAFCRTIILPENFENQINTFLRALEIDSISKNIAFTKILEDYNSAAHYYYKLLLAPALSGLNPDINKLHIIADSVLSRIPFEILLTKEINTSEVKERQVNYCFTKLPYLARDYAITYNYSATLALQMAAMKGDVIEGAEVLAFAPFATISEAGDMKFACRGNELDSLPGSWHEIEAIANYFDGYYFTKEKATERNFKTTTSREDHDIIHVCTHGEARLNEVHENARIYFNQEAQDSLHDNTLHAYEIYNMPLNAQLVVLSACETGRGKYKKGEGLMSLARAFSYAGCPGLVMTLWEVDDMASAVLMDFFYKALSDGMTTELALQQARLNYLEKELGNASAKTHVLSAHPYYWAGYIGLGKNIQVLAE